MNSELLIKFLVFWGIWILIPMLIDGSTAIIHMIYGFTVLKRKKRTKISSDELKYYPLITILIPVYNAASTLYNCLNSLYQQTYPLDRMEVIAIDNGGTDESFKVYQDFNRFCSRLNCRWMRLDCSGKSRALNVGIFSGKGQYYISVDSDAILKSDAVLNMVKSFESDLNIVGATGVVLIDIDQVTNERSFLRTLQLCELFEYIQAFYISRSFQSHFNTLFTMAGAFSAFRKTSLLKTYLYDQSTVAEDTKLTFDLRYLNPKNRMVLANESIALVEPISSLSNLYSQRLRWQRGQLEVAAHYESKSCGRIWSLISSFFPRVIFADHTLALPRMGWLFLLPVLYIMGYPLSLILGANIIIYLMYVMIDSVYLYIAMACLENEYSSFIKKHAWILLFLPLYRFVVYWFRIAGIIDAVTVEGQWDTGNPFQQMRTAFKQMKRSLISRLPAKHFKVKA